MDTEKGADCGNRICVYDSLGQTVIQMAFPVPGATNENSYKFRKYL